MEQAGDGLEHGGLAGAVGADDDDDLAAIDVESDLVKHFHSGVGARQPGHVEEHL